MSYRTDDTEYYGDRRTSVTVPQRFVEAASRFDTEPAQSYARRTGPVRSLAGRAFPRPAAGDRATLTYGDLGGIVADLAAGFRRLADAGDRVALCLGSRAEWAQVDLALQAAGLVTVTVPPAATPAETERALAEQDVAGAVLPDEDALDRTGTTLDGGFAVLADGTGHAENVAIHALASVRRDGAEAFDPSLYERWVFDRSPDETATVVYDRATGGDGSASGTEDDPLRGRAFSHAALAVAVETAVTGGTGHPDPTATSGPSLRRPGPGDTVLASRSPTARYARVTAHLTPLTVGATVAYPAAGESLVDDLRALRPDLVYAAAADCTVMVETLRERADQGLTSGLVGWALDRRTDGEDVLDRLALRRLRRTFDGVGPIMRPTTEAGGAGADAATTLCRAGITVERYRPLPGTAMALPPDSREGAGDPTAGLPLIEDALPGLETRQEPTDDGAAELLVRGSAVFDGFPAEPGVTLGAFERGNWFRTGLVGPRDSPASREDDTSDGADESPVHDGAVGDRDDRTGDRDETPTGVTETQGAAD
jgi:long-chain acyl-CoA synthetase